MISMFERDALYGITRNMYVDGITRELYLTRMAAKLANGILREKDAVSPKLHALAQRYQAALEASRIEVPAAFKDSLDQEALDDLVQLELLPLGGAPACGVNCWCNLMEDETSDDADEDLDEDEDDPDEDDLDDDDLDADQVDEAPEDSLDLSPEAFWRIRDKYYFFADDEGNLLGLGPRIN